MRLVLDTNVIVSAIGWSGPPSAVLEALIAGQHTLVTTPELLSEVTRALSYPKMRVIATQPATAEILRWLHQPEHLVPAREHLTVILEDPSDDRVLEAALAGRADYIVSGDQHLLRLGSFRGIPIVAPRQLLEEDTRRR